MPGACALFLPPGGRERARRTRQRSPSAGRRPDPPESLEEAAGLLAAGGKNLRRRSLSRLAKGAREGCPHLSLLADLGVVAPVLWRFKEALEAEAPPGLGAGGRA